MTYRDHDPECIALVACSKSKLEHAAPARELYCSALFRHASTYAVRHARRWFVLSAKHGLLAPHEQIAPYELTLKQMSLDERRQWAVRVIAQLETHGVHLNARFLWLAGAAYTSPLLPYLPGAIHIQPLAGLGIGQQLQFLATKHPPLPNQTTKRPSLPPPGPTKSVNAVDRVNRTPPRSIDFKAALAEMLSNAARAGHAAIRVRAGDLHRVVGGYPGANARMPSCCGAMRSMMAMGDRILAEPPKGNGASLEIEYLLPRRT